MGFQWFGYWENKPVREHGLCGGLTGRRPLPDNNPTTITLAKDVEEFLQELVRVGASADATELANDALRSLREQQRRPFHVTPELEA
jgi:hypothetical protein